ncbi:hypothetical protein FAGAP_10126 [Fusarium agapanthi]|uniref:C3H1-type domain-containing protein n=1 Tax=Fusarium agapanthi TaxID=1803897 RepID=A0A9P5EAT8_9HYPO|nr:hypothetical protein FAGAP_10126 [Fusarium agapanthi]
MELTTICFTALIISFLLIGNSPIQMPREAWGYTLATVFFAVIGGASFFGQIIHTALPALRQTHDTPEDYFEHLAKVLHHGRVKFSAPDHHFNRKFGICCDQEGHCINDQQKGAASLSPEDDNKPNGEGEGEVPQSRVERELMRFRRLKNDFFRPAAAAVVEEESRALRRDRNFKRLCRKFRKGHCRRGASCDLFHFLPWELPGRDYTDHPVDLFFANFKGFESQRDKSFFDEFYRMCDYFGWSDDEATEPWYNFRIALIEEFNYVFGKDENNLRNWKKMFKIIGLSEPTSLDEARTIMRPTRVNLVDMLQSTRTGEPVQRFETLEALSRYSYNTPNQPHDDGTFHDNKLFLNHNVLHENNSIYRTKVFRKDDASRDLVPEPVPWNQARGYPAVPE